MFQNRKRRLLSEFNCECGNSWFDEIARKSVEQQCTNCKAMVYTDNAPYTHSGGKHKQRKVRKKPHNSRDSDSERCDKDDAEINSTPTEEERSSSSSGSETEDKLSS